MTTNPILPLPCCHSIWRVGACPHLAEIARCAVNVWRNPDAYFYRRLIGAYGWALLADYRPSRPSFYAQLKR